MKQKLLLKTMLLLFALIAGSSSVWATTITKTMSEIVFANNYTISASSDVTCYTSFALDANITISTTGSANCGSFWGTSPNIDWRLYQNKSGNITITAATGYALQSITITYSVSNSGTLKDGTTTISSGSAQSVSGSSKTYTVGNTGEATNGQVKVTQISVTYQDTSDTRTETTVTITGNETGRYTDQSATTPSATVKAGDTPIDGVSVTWSSTETGVATINSSTGAIALVAPGTTTIKAQYAGNATYKPSENSYTLNVYGVFNGISALQTANASAPYNTGTGTLAKITFTNAKVTHVSGYYAYISDEAGYGAQIYKNGHGFTAGNIINGTVSGVTLCKYTTGATVVKNASATSEGLTITNGTVSPLTKTINAVSTANQSMMVKFENVTYVLATTSFTDGVNTIAYKDQFSVNPTLADGGKYDVTGLLIMDEGVLKVAPISADGIESKTVNPTSQWKNGETALSSITINKAEGTKKYTFETNSDGAVTYESSNTDIATIASDGTITPKGYGTTTITANVAGTEDYNPDSKSFTLKVVDAGVDVIQISDITFESGTGYKNWTSVSGLTTTATYAGQSNKGVSYIQIRKQSPSGIVTTASAGRAKKVSVIWAGGNTNNRKLTIYGKNTAYTSGSDLYGDGKGTELGTITFTTGVTSGELEIAASKNYGYIGISADGAMYIGTLIIEWDENVRCVEIGQYEWATFVSDQIPYFEGSGINAYIVTGHNGNAITKSDALTTAPANTPLLLNAAKGTYSIPFAAFSTTNVDGNLLKKGTGAAISKEDGKTKYVLGIEGGKATFLKIDGTAATVPTDKAYLEFDEEINAPVLSFDGEGTTGIKVIDNGQLTIDNYYNLAGQRVAQPTKGLYIVNGKKVVIK